MVDDKQIYGDRHSTRKLKKSPNDYMDRHRGLYGQAPHKKIKKPP